MPRRYIEFSLLPIDPALEPGEGEVRQTERASSEHLAPDLLTAALHESYTTSHFGNSLLETASTFLRVEMNTFAQISGERN